MGDRHGHKKMVPSGKARYNEMGTALGEERGRDEPEKRKREAYRTKV